MPLFGLLALPTAAGCQLDGGVCGPSTAVVDRVIDASTVFLDNGERMRSAFVDPPSIAGQQVECFGEEATQFKRELLLGREVELEYGAPCRDAFNRLLGTIIVDETRDVSELLVERGYACVDDDAPTDAERLDALRELEAEAREVSRGMWGVCPEVPCAD